MRVRWLLDGITFNGPPDQLGREWVIDREAGWSASPPVRNDQAQPRTGTHGGWPPRVLRDPRSIRLDGWLYAPTWEARRDAEHRLAALCSIPGRGYELRVSEELGDLVATVTQDDATLVTIRPGGLWLDFSIQLAAADPRKYSVVELTAEAGLPGDSATGLDFEAGDGGGLDFAGGGLDFGPQVSTGRATVTNTGTADTQPRLTLSGPLAPPITVTRPDTPGFRLVYLDPLGAADRLVIDAQQRTVLLDGITRRHRAIITDWDALIVQPQSTVELALRHGAVPNDAARLQLAWRSAWW